MARLIAIAALVVIPAFGGEWNKRLTAGYMDGRQKDWFAWRAAKAEGGPCLSCHTGLTYMLARPALRQALHESAPTPYETGLMDGLRARLPKTDPPKDAHDSQRMGVEAVLSSLLLTDSPQAFERLWRLQISEGKDKGAWDWFDLNLNPWEMPESKFFGVTMAAMAVGSATPEYRSRPEVRDHVAALIGYLERERDSQSLHNKLMLLWASTRLPEVMPAGMRRKVLEDVWRAQQSDGGWTLESLGPWKEHPAAPPSAGGSNSYATAVAAFVLQEAAGVKRSNANLGKALDWLCAHQDPKQGSWQASSMNKKFEPGSMQIQFMNDAATAFATLALLDGEKD